MVSVPLHIQLGRLAAIRRESVDVQSVRRAHGLQHRADPVDQLLVDWVRLSSAACLPKISFCACAGTLPA